MADQRITGDFPTHTVKRHWIATRPDGRHALLLEVEDNQIVAFELPKEVIRKLTSDLANLSAQTEPPSKPNA